MSCNLKVSFCTPCKGRAEHLKQTLPENIKNSAGYPNVEFVILDYGSEDGLEEWVKENLQAEIQSGKVRYAKVDPVDAPHFRMAHAKNMAHRVATGDVLCNLDADNYIPAGFAAWINEQFSRNPDIIAQVDRLSLLPRLITHRGTENIRGLGDYMGRKVISRSNFYKLHGYDERFEGYGERHSTSFGDDNNFADRAVASGIIPVKIPAHLVGHAIHHGDEHRLEHLAPDVLEATTSALKRMQGMPGVIRRLGHMAVYSPKNLEDANTDGNFGCGKITLNFNESLELKPLTSINQEVAQHSL